ncbi:hypothetical protein [Hymenobacter sp.]|jgi:hypothetical protein|uniref:hypothetical protein n=1 Tax=Hymenobacter sp. TaxID=1898978 RepID=UPI002EDB3C1E
MILSLLLSDEYILGLVGSIMTFITAFILIIGFAIALFLVLKNNPTYRTIGLVLAWILALASAQIWDDDGKVLFFVLFLPLLLGLYKAFSWLRK